MFGKRRPLASSAAAEPAGLDLLALGLDALRNPAVSAGGAGPFFVAAALTAVLVAGDPHAGVPSVRFALSQPGQPAPPPGWREALAPDAPGDAPVTTGSLSLSDATPADSTAAGQATITVPDAGDGSTQSDNTANALPPAPYPGFTEPGPGGGVLPIISQDGRTPAEAYARPFQSNGKPKIALVIGGLGLNPKTTRQAIEQLPANVTLSFVPYADGLQSWIDLARANGHEVLLEAPMEPNDYPDNDPGPFTLLAGAKPQDTLQKLDWLLSRATGYFGITNYLGSRFVSSDQAMTTLANGLRHRGLAFIDDGSAARYGGGLMRASADRVIDDQLATDMIDRQLQALETTALQNGQALGSGFAYPVTLDEVGRWAADLAQHGYQLAPASAVMMRR